MLCLKGKDLVVGLFGDSLALESGPVEVLGLLVGDLDVLTVNMVDSDLVPHLLSHNVDLLPQGLVLTLQVVVLDQVLVELVLESLDQMGILDDLGGLWTHLLELLLLLGELITSLLVLVLENHQTPKTVTCKIIRVFKLITKEGIKILTSSRARTSW